MIVNPSMLMPAISEQISVFLRALLLGVLLGALYDVFRVVRVLFGVRYGGNSFEKLFNKELPFIGAYRVLRQKDITDKIRNAIVCAGDILFSVVSAFVVSIFIYRYCYGIVRWYVFFGALLGFVAYYFTVGRLILAVTEIIMFLLVTSIKYILYFVFRPIVLIISRIKRLHSKPQR